MIKIVRSVNASLWIILGILIGVWLIFPDKILEKTIWIGFVVGCISMGAIDIYLIWKPED